MSFKRRGDTDDNFDDTGRASNEKHRTESSTLPSTDSSSDSTSCCSTESTECRKCNCVVHGAAAENGSGKEIRIVRDAYTLHQFEQRHRVWNAKKLKDFTECSFDINMNDKNPDERMKKYHAPRGLFRRFLPTSFTWRSTIFSLLPILTWLPKYRWRADIVPDIICGLTVLSLNIPQGLAYTEIAGVKPQYGLYVSLFAVPVYAILGTSKHLSVGTYAVVTLMCRDVADRYIESHPEMKDYKIDIMVTLCLLTGVIQLIVGILRLGMWTTLMSDNFLDAFLMACAILIFNSQMPGFLGVKVTGEYTNLTPLPFINDWVGIFSVIQQAHLPTILVGSTVLAFLCFSKYYFDPVIFMGRWKFTFPFPMDLLCVIVSTLVSSVFNFKEKFNVPVVGYIPQGIEPPVLPRMNYAPELIFDAFMMMVVSSVCSWSLAKTVAKRLNYPVSVNQEFIAYGAANFFASFFDCFPMSGSLSRTVIQEHASGRSQMASLVGSSVLIVFIYFFTTYLELLPKVTLCSIILVTLFPSFGRFKDVKKIWDVSRFECLLWMVTFLGVSLFGVSAGIIAGLLTSVLILLVRAAVPTTTVKCPVPNSEIYVSPSDYNGLNEKEMLKYKAVVFAFQGPLCFLSVGTFRTDLENKILLHLDRFHTSELQTYTNNAFEECEKEGPEDDEDEDDNNDNIEDMEKGDGRYSVPTVHKSKLTIILDMSQMLYIDLSGLETLQKTYGELKQQNISLVLAACTTSVLSTLERANFFTDTMSKSECFPTLHDAVVGHRQICVFNTNNNNNL